MKAIEHLFIIMYTTEYTTVNENLCTHVGNALKFETNDFHKYTVGNNNINCII